MNKSRGKFLAILSAAFLVSRMSMAQNEEVPQGPSDEVQALLSADSSSDVSDRLPDDLKMAAECDEEPGDTEVRFWIDRLYQGPCFTHTLGYEPRLTGWQNDSISSLQTGRSVSVYACEDKYLGGRCQYWEAEDPNLKDSWVGNDKITSFLIVKTGTELCPPHPDLVTFYIHKGYLGSCVGLGVGKYRNPDQIGLPNDSISSFKVGANVKVCPYRNTDFTGRRFFYTTDQYDLGDTYIGNDSISSVWIVKRSGYCGS